MSDASPPSYTGGTPAAQVPWFKARPTIYRGIRMRSRLEALWAAELDVEKQDPMDDLITWQYEPMCFAGPAGQYLPDFGLEYPHSHAYAEIKPSLVDPMPLMRRMEIIHESDPLAELVIYAGHPTTGHDVFVCQRFGPDEWFTWAFPDGRLATVPAPAWFRP